MKQRGFTVLEVVIAITIAAFILMSAAPAASSWMRNTRIRTTAESITNGLMQARNEAVRRNQPVGFYLVSDTDAISMTDGCALSATGAGWVVALNSPAGQCASSLNSFIAARPPGDVGGGLAVASVDNTPAAANAAIFNGYGQVTNANAIACIRVSNSSDSTARRLNISVNSGGQIRMCDPAVGSTDPRVCPAGCS